MPVLFMFYGFCLTAKQISPIGDNTAKVKVDWQLKDSICIILLKDGNKSTVSLIYRTRAATKEYFVIDSYANYFHN